MAKSYTEQHMMIVEYPDGTFRVYEDKRRALQEYKRQEGETTTIIRRLTPAAS